MKAAAFAYARATSVVNALELLAAHGDRSKGSVRRAEPRRSPLNLRSFTIPDLDDRYLRPCRVAGHRGARGRDLVIAALTRHVDLLRSPEVALHGPTVAGGRRSHCPPGHFAIAGTARRKPGARRSRLRTACLHRRAGRNPTSFVLESGERQIAAVRFFQGDLRDGAVAAKGCLLRSNYRPQVKARRFSFRSMRSGMAITPIAGLAARAIVDRPAGFRICGRRFSAVGDRPLLGSGGPQADQCVRYSGRARGCCDSTVVDELDPHRGSAGRSRHAPTSCCCLVAGAAWPSLLCAPRPGGGSMVE